MINLDTIAETSPQTILQVTAGDLKEFALTLIKEATAKKQPDEYRVPEAAHILGVSERTIYSYIYSGRLEARKTGNKMYITRESIEKELQRKI